MNRNISTTVVTNILAYSINIIIGNQTTLYNSERRGNDIVNILEIYERKI